MNTSSSDMVTMVKAFHSKAGYEYERRPNVEDANRRDLWVKLISEEHKELLSALEAKDIYGVADGIADSLYVLIGAALAFAIPIDEVFKEVHESNMTKIETTVLWRDDRKILRSAGYKRPNIKPIIDRAMSSK